MLLLCYPKCSTCKKAKKWLDDNNVEYTERDIALENPSFDELKAWYEKSGLPLKRFFNTSGMIYREMSLKDKLPEMSEQEQLELLSTNGMLVKRPLVIDGDTVLTGFQGVKEWEENIVSIQTHILSVVCFPYFLLSKRKYTDKLSARWNNGRYWN